MVLATCVLSRVLIAKWKLTRLTFSEKQNACVTRWTNYRNNYCDLVRAKSEAPINKFIMAFEGKAN